MEVSKTLLSFVADSEEITGCLKNVDFHFDVVIRTCYSACVTEETTVDIVHKFDMEMLLDFLHDELNTGHWSEVTLDVRRAFQAASFLKTIIIFKRSSVVTTDVVREALKCVDMGLLLGAPLERNCDLLNKCATCLSKEINRLHDKEFISTTADMKPKGLKRKYVSAEAYDRLQATEINTLKCPSLATFNKQYFVRRFPLKLQGNDYHFANCN